MKTAKTLPRVYWSLIAVLAFFAMAASSPECARSNDVLLSPNSEILNDNGNQVSECVQACVDAAKIRRADEQARHKSAIKDCGNNKDCKKEEAALHSAIMRDIAEDERDCKRPCHEQGGGSGGQ